MIQYKNLFIAAMAVMALASCKTTPTEEKTNPVQEQKVSEDELEAREDSLKLVQAYQGQEKIAIAVKPIIETQTVDAKATDDAADDPAIWINPKDAEKSLIFGSNKKGGIAVYDLKGTELSYAQVGKVNNIEVIYDITLNGKKVSLLGGTNRSSQSIDLYLIEPEKTAIKEVLSYKIDSTIIDDVYGFCFAKSKTDNKAYAIVNGKNGVMQQFAIDTKKDIQLTLARTIKFDGQVEGMVADYDYNNLFVGEENHGVWKLSIDPTSQEKQLLATSTAANNPNISYDIEGLALLKQGKEGYLVASSQGNFSYALFNRTGDNAYVNSFKVIDGAVDGTQETDGLVINTTPIGEAYPNGIMIIQDGFNYDGKDLKPQNFKYVSVKELTSQLKK